MLPLLGAVSVGDERGVSVRLEALEAAHRAGMDEMKRMVAAIARGTAQHATTPDIVVTSPSFAAVASGNAETGTNQNHTKDVRQDTGILWARSAPGARPDRSGSRKRQREGEGGEWREVTHQRGRKPRARPKAVTGTATLAEFDDLAGPEQFWIGNTRASTDEAKVKEVLEKCAKILSIDSFSVENVHGLTKEDNPRTRSWKVTVPARFKEVMSDPAMYPKGWSHRAFHQGPRRQEGAVARGAAVNTEARQDNV